MGITFVRILEDVRGCSHCDPLLHETELRRQDGTPAKYSATSRQLFTRANPVAARLCGAV
jgi:hypothetical protein